MKKKLKIVLISSLFAFGSYLESRTVGKARDAIRDLMDLAPNLATVIRDGKENGISVNLPLSRDGLANLIGITQETLSRKLSELQEEGIISMQGQKKILIKRD
jgi:CRP/FNR family transcriptional regulator